MKRIIIAVCVQFDRHADVRCGLINSFQRSADIWWKLISTKYVTPTLKQCILLLFDPTNQYYNGRDSR